MLLELLKNMFRRRPRSAGSAAPAPDVDRTHEGLATRKQTVRESLDAGQPDEAATLLHAMLADTPDDPEIWRLLGTARCDLEQFDTALEAFREAVAKAPEDAASHCHIGMIVKDFGDLETAERHLREALRIDPAIGAAHFNLGLLLFEQGRHDAALKSLGACRTLERGPQWGDAPGRAEPPAADEAEPIAVFKLRHDLDQLRHLRGATLLDDEADTIASAYAQFLEQLPPEVPATARIQADASVPALVRATYNRPAYLAPATALDGPTVNPSLDTAAVQAAYLDSDPSIVYVDDVLSEPARLALWRFCLESAIWHDVKDGYLGAYMKDGFHCGLLLQIAHELRVRLPRILDGHQLQTMWAYKYDASLEGIGLHADQAAVNVNFWITPDSANLDPEHGGLEVYVHHPPQDWSFRHYNAESEAIRAYLESVDSDVVRVPYRCNRAVIFDSDLFHCTDDFHFAEGYENRRINVTFLYGLRSAPAGARRSKLAADRRRVSGC